MTFEPVLTRNVGIDGSCRLEVYRRHGGYRALEKALKIAPAEIVKQVTASGLRGRGGAGFPTGRKWTFLPPDRQRTYLCVNADESEPGTFCNRVQMEHDPHQVLEGTIISAYAIRAQAAYIYIRYEFAAQQKIMQRAVDEAYAAGLLGRNILGSGYDLDITVYSGAGAYICGEETGLLESIEGRRPWPRPKPPYPAVEGLFGEPTIINNVETLACVVHIIDRGPDWFRSIGTPQSTGPKLFCVSGHVNRPGCYERPLGVALKEIIYELADGVRGGRRIKAVVPGGISTGVLTADELDVTMDFESFTPVRNGCLGLGTAAVIVMDETTDMLRVLHNTARFFAHESCGQCTQCREGTGWIYKMTTRMLAGGGREEDLDIIDELTDRMGMMSGQSICGLPDGAAFPLRCIVRKFRDELIERMTGRERIPAAVV
jgi:NADH-quinone oxidoreductase subunit F